MRKKPVNLRCDVPFGTTVKTLTNCVLETDTTIVVVNPRLSATVIFADALGEYRAEFIPDWSWVWG